MQDIYENPTVRQLAACLEARHSESVNSATPLQAGPVPAAPTPPVSAFRYAFCGAIQLLVFLGYTMYTAWLLVFGYEWTLGEPPSLTCGFEPWDSVPPCSWSSP